MKQSSHILIEKAFREVLTEDSSYNIEKRYYLNIKPGILTRSVKINYFNNKNVLAGLKKLESFNNPVPPFTLRTGTSITRITFKEIQKYLAGVFRDDPRYGLTTLQLLSNYQKTTLSVGKAKNIQIKDYSTETIIKFHSWMNNYFIKNNLLLYLTTEEWDAITGKGESTLKKIAKGAYGGFIGFGKSW